jgi:hypothetical protein
MGFGRVQVEDIAPQINEEFDKAEAKYNDSLRYKADFYDGAVGMGQLAFERAKLHTGLLVPAAPAAAEADAAKAAAEAANAQMREALGKVTADKAKTADKLFDKVSASESFVPSSPLDWAMSSSCA